MGSLIAIRLRDKRNDPFEIRSCSKEDFFSLLKMYKSFSPRPAFQINVSGHRLGTAGIESALVLHKKVAAVISKGAEPDDGVSYLKAFLTIHKGFTPSVRLNHEIKAFVKANLSQDIIVKEISFLDRLPRTRSGKLLRRVLRAGELGLPAGETANMKD